MRVMKCKSCNENDAEIHKIYGYLDCKECRDRLKDRAIISGVMYELTTDEIREGRKQFKNELVQPYRQGEFSKEFREAHPKISRGMVKEGAITQKQHDKAKDVWGRDRY